MAAVLMVFSISQRSWSSGNVSINLRDQVIRAIMTMNKELSQGPAAGANQINLVTGASSNSVTFYLPHDNGGYGSVVNPAGNIQWAGPYTYSLNGSRQIIRTFGATWSVLANYVTSLQFTRSASRIIQVNITARQTPTAGQQLQDTEQAIIKIRN